MFEEKLAQNLGEIKGIQLVSAVYQNNDDCLNIVLSYPDGVILSKEQKDEIKNVVKQIVGTGIKETNIQLKKRYIDAEMAKAQLIEYIKTEFPLFYALIQNSIEIQMDGSNATISIIASDDIKEYATERCIAKKIEKYMTEKLSCEVSVKISYIESADESLGFEQEFLPADEEQQTRHIKVFNKSKYIGEEIEEEPLYISDVKVPAETLTICGVIDHFSLREYTTKSGKTRFISKFALKDPTGEFSVFMFVSESQKPKMEKLQNGIELLCRGSCEEGQYGDLELRCKDIMLCEIQKNFTEEIHFKPEPKTYIKVFPEKIEYNKQLTLFESAQKTTKYLEENDVVVFDLETTGLNFLESEIIEIGAIKIKKGGAISERFSTFVKPTKDIPKEITDLTGITNEDVKDGTPLATALADFYKFTRGSTLVGHNISFDYGFINYYGRKVGYDFSTNPQHDTYKLAQKYLPGLKNYKLKTVADYFGVSLKNAHRAYNDAYATAEVFMKLTEFFDKV